MEIKDLIQEYLRHLRALNTSGFTQQSSKSVLKLFAAFLAQEGITGIEELTRDVLEEYREEIAFAFTAKGKPLALRTQSKRLSVVKAFTRYLKEHDYLVDDPGARLKHPRTPRRLPRAILNEPDMRKLLAAPDSHTNHGYRNRVILELLYDTAIRRSETAGIRLTDIDLDGGCILIRGKGDKERVVPLSDRVCGILRNYILAVRPCFVKGTDPGYLFLNRWGAGVHPHVIWTTVHNASRQAKLKSQVSTHMLRHTCATHMLRNGAPVRHIQEMLGHESLETTQIYTHVTINDLKEVHAKYHPSSKEASP
jgi:integrase/recombinase XerD